MFINGFVPVPGNGPGLVPDFSSPETVLSETLRAETEWADRQLHTLDEMMAGSQRSPGKGDGGGEGSQDSIQAVDVLCGQLLLYFSEHFMWEDSLMHRGFVLPELRDELIAHVEAHAEMMALLNQAMDAHSRKGTLLGLKTLLSQRFKPHVETYDTELMAFLAAGGWIL